MKYIITGGNISVTIGDTPYLIGRDHPKFEELKHALQTFQPEYMIKQIVDPDPEIEEAIEMLKGNFRDEQ
jgi:hypothetical protein